ncbi:MAG: hypothetical protein V1644_02710 [Candidatus Micrarchaeota archaeon]
MKLFGNVKIKKTKKIKVKRKIKKKKAVAKVPAAIKAAKKRHCIDIAIPSDKLWVCKIGKHKIAFIKGHRDLPLGVIHSRKNRSRDVLLSVHPFDSLEHEHVINHICVPKK